MGAPPPSEDLGSSEWLLDEPGKPDCRRNRREPMDHFSYRGGELWCEDVALSRLAERVGTPAYVYSRKTFEDHYRSLVTSFTELHPEVRFSVKSCSNLHLLRLLAGLGAGMDVVSGGELFRSLEAGVSPDKICFAGVGKTDRELREALAVKVGWINAESEQELEAIERIARELNHRASVAVRVNPDVADSKTPTKTSTGGRGTKFGIDIDRIVDVFERFGRSDALDLSGLHFHIGSPIYGPEPYVAVIQRALALMDQLKTRGFHVTTLNLGGGYMAHYGHSDVPARGFRDYGAPLAEALRPFLAAGGRIVIEPGRSISANAGVLLTRVLYLKRSGDRRVAVVDTGMTHLARPALYDAEHFIWPVAPGESHTPPSRDPRTQLETLERYDVVGPICESTDRLAVDRALPPFARGDLLAIFSAGAYGMVMASQYNAVPRPPEVLVEGSRCTLIRRRETYQDLIAPELDAVALD